MPAMTGYSRSHDEQTSASRAEARSPPSTGHTKGMRSEGTARLVVVGAEERRALAHAQPRDRVVERVRVAAEQQHALAGAPGERRGAGSGAGWGEEPRRAAARGVGGVLGEPHGAAARPVERHVAAQLPADALGPPPLLARDDERRAHER